MDKEEQCRARLQSLKEHFGSANIMLNMLRGHRVLNRINRATLYRWMKPGSVLPRRAFLAVEILEGIISKEPAGDFPKNKLQHHLDEIVTVQKEVRKLSLKLNTLVKELKYMISSQ